MVIDILDKNTTNRVSAVESMIKFFFRSKKTNIEEFEKFINTLISFGLSLTELTYLIDLISSSESYYLSYGRAMVGFDISKIKRILSSKLVEKTRNQKTLLKYNNFLRTL